MMFIDVTRYGGLRVQRLNIAAIAYLDRCEGGCAVHLLGGETLRVNEDEDEVELRCMAAIEEAAPTAPPPQADLPEAPPTAAPPQPPRARSQGKQKQ